jgi:hypothetical protein
LVLTHTLTLASPQRDVNSANSGAIHFGEFGLENEIRLRNTNRHLGSNPPDPFRECGYRSK